jgi:hypothetical protein
MKKQKSTDVICDIGLIVKGVKFYPYFGCGHLKEKWDCFGGDEYFFYYFVRGHLYQFMTLNKDRLDQIADVVNFLVSQTDFFIILKHLTCQ